MSSTDSDIRSGAKRAGASPRDADDLANQIDAIRADLQNLSGTVTRIAKGQVNRAQDKAMETAYEAEEAIRRNPLQAVAIIQSPTCQHKIGPDLRAKPEIRARWKWSDLQPFVAQTFAFVFVQMQRVQRRCKQRVELIDHIGSPGCLFV